MRASDHQADSIGIDFGTTNSSVALVTPGAPVELASFSFLGAPVPSFRSVLYIEQIKAANGIKRSHSLTGPAAIEHYLEADEKGRLIQSLKSHLTSRKLTGTEVFGRRFTSKNSSPASSATCASRPNGSSTSPFAPPPSAAPSASSAPNPTKTTTSPSNACAKPSPSPASTRSTSNSSPSPPPTPTKPPSTTTSSSSSATSAAAPATSRSFASAPASAAAAARPTICWATAASAWPATPSTPASSASSSRPALGSNSEARSFNKKLPAVPAWIYANLERWHYLSFLRTNNVREILKGARARALEPDKIEALIAIVDGDLGYQLHQSVQQVKFELSRADAAEFRFRDGTAHAHTIDLRIPVTRAEFESWIVEELAAIERSIDQLLAQSGVAARDVDRVFLTGGSSFVPAVRRIFATRFGADRIRGGNEFTSVAHGLALRAADPLPA